MIFLFCGEIHCSVDILRAQAQNRELAPLKRESTPVEALMDSIRNSGTRSSLRKTPGPRIRSSGFEIRIS